MTLLERCELAKQKGYTYDSITGKVTGVRKKEIKDTTGRGYVRMWLYKEKKKYMLCAHHFAWYMHYGNVDFQMLDHFNQDKADNRIENLRIANHQINQHNRLNTTKGYCFIKGRNIWKAGLSVNNKKIFLGYFKEEKDAREAYLNGKKKYHHLYYEKK